MATYGLIDCLCQWLSDFFPEELPLLVARVFFPPRHGPLSTANGVPHIAGSEGENEEVKIAHSLLPNQWKSGQKDISVPNLAFIRSRLSPTPRKWFP